MTEREVGRLFREKYRRNIRKDKLKRQFRGRYIAEIVNTAEKLTLLMEIEREERGE